MINLGLVYPKFIRFLNDDTKRVPYRWLQKMYKYQHALIALRHASDIEYRLYFDGCDVILLDPYYNLIVWHINYHTMRGSAVTLLRRLEKLTDYWNGKVIHKTENYLHYIKRKYDE